MCPERVCEAPIAAVPPARHDARSGSTGSTPVRRCSFIMLLSGCQLQLVCCRRPGNIRLPHGPKSTQRVPSCPVFQVSLESFML